MSAGHIRRRGKATWEIKFDVGRDPLTGRRRIRYTSFKGTKRQAEIELARLVTSDANGTSVDPSRVTLADFLDRWERDWAAGNVGPKTRERYVDLLRVHVRPHLGTTLLQKLRPIALTELYAKLLCAGRGVDEEGEPRGLAPRTVGHVHRVLHRVLGHAARWALVTQNVASLVSPPRVQAREIAIVGDVGDLLKRLRDRPIYPIASLALATGMRRGELLALRWRDVDFDRATIRVEQSVELTRAGMRIKAPKTRHGRRSISVPATIVSELRTRWRQEQEQRLALGKGAGDSLVFHAIDDGPLHPAGVTKEWHRAMVALGVSGITLHSLRHTHASQLIAAGIDVITVSRRLGHGSPTITLGVYGHLFSNTDDRVAAIMEATFASAK